MIQRIQSLYLLLAATSYVALFFLPIAKTASPFGSIMADGLFYTTEHNWLTALAALATVVMFITIFLYNNRLLQLKMCLLATLFSAGWLLMALYNIVLLDQMGGEDVFVKHSIAFFAFLAGIFFTAFAFYNIKQDENTVRSMDSLR
jgi:hypothetical protein